MQEQALVCTWKAGLKSLVFAQVMGQSGQPLTMLLRSSDERDVDERGLGRRPEYFDGFDEDPLMCRRCGQQITSSAQRISVGGLHEHTFSNPEGILFHIGCFGHVLGCRFYGDPTGQWSWFKGYRWQVTYCGECNLHLGWHFSSAGHSFHGLVLRNLVRLS